MSTPAVLAVVGPTAAGKSDLALDLAEALGGSDRVEIINADSMQVYQGMDIGTAKLPVVERRGITHHLLDVWPVSYSVTVADYQGRARAVVDDVLARGRTPMLVGGSGLYVTAVVDDLRFPGTDPVVRARWEARLAEVGPRRLHEQLHEVDPTAAAKILPSNGRRLVRALEVVELTGAPFAADLPAAGAAPVYPARFVGVDRAPDELAERIAVRVERMWRSGLPAEVRHLQEQGLASARTASRALGYSQALGFLRGELTEAEAVERTVIATRRFARRQRSWFRRDTRITWFDASAAGVVAGALRTIEE